MILEISVFLIAINLLYEILEIVFPMSKMSVYVKSFVSIIFLYIICLKLGKLF